MKSLGQFVILSCIYLLSIIFYLLPPRSLNCRFLLCGRRKKVNTLYNIRNNLFASQIAQLHLQLWRNSQSISSLRLLRFVSMKSTWWWFRHFLSWCHPWSTDEKKVSNSSGSSSWVAKRRNDFRHRSCIPSAVVASKIRQQDWNKNNINNSNDK